MNFQFAVAEIFFAIRQLEQDYATRAQWTPRVTQLCINLCLMPGNKTNPFTYESLQDTCSEIYSILADLSSRVNRWPRLSDATWNSVCLSLPPSPPLVRS